MGILAVGGDTRPTRGPRGPFGRSVTAAIARHPLFATASVRTIALPVLFGLAFGILASVANHAAQPAAGLVPKLVGSVWMWLAVPYLTAWLGRRWWGSVTAALAFTLTAVWGYHTTDMLYGGYVGPSVPGLMSGGREGMLVDAAWHSLGALALSVAAATLVVLVRRGGILGILAAGVVPAYIAGDAFFWLPYAPDSESAAAAITAGAMAVPAAVVAVGFGVGRLVRGLRPRRPSARRSDAVPRGV